MNRAAPLSVCWKRAVLVLMFIAAWLLTSCKKTHRAESAQWEGDLVRAVRRDDVDAVARIFVENSLSPDELLKKARSATPLIIASHAGSRDVARWLLDRGAKPDVVTKVEEDSPLIVACGRGHAEIVRLLVERRANINYQNSHGMSALMWAITQDHSAIAEYLITEGANIHAAANIGRTPLMMACEKGNVSLARLLLEKGAKVNHIDEDGEHALMDAAAAGQAEVIALLAAQGAEIDRQNLEGWTALLKAAPLGHCEAVKALCEAGADPTKRNKFGRSALEYGRGITGTNQITTVSDVREAVDAGLFSREESYYVLARKGSGRDYDCIVKVLADYEARFQRPASGNQPE